MHCIAVWLLKCAEWTVGGAVVAPSDRNAIGSRSRFRTSDALQHHALRALRGHTNPEKVSDRTDAHPPDRALRPGSSAFVSLTFEGVIRFPGKESLLARWQLGDTTAITQSDDAETIAESLDYVCCGGHPHAARRFVGR